MTKHVISLIALLLSLASPAFADGNARFKRVDFTHMSPAEVDNWIKGKCFDNKRGKHTCGKGVIVQVLYGAEPGLETRISKMLSDYVQNDSGSFTRKFKLRFIYAGDLDKNRQTADVITYKNGEMVTVSEIHTNIGLLNEDFKKTDELYGALKQNIKRALEK